MLTKGKYRHCPFAWRCCRKHGDKIGGVRKTVYATRHAVGGALFVSLPGPARRSMVGRSARAEISHRNFAHRFSALQWSDGDRCRAFITVTRRLPRSNAHAGKQQRQQQRHQPWFCGIGIDVGRGRKIVVFAPPTVTNIVDGRNGKNGCHRRVSAHRVVFVRVK